jgi:ribonuclease P protein component
MATTDHVAHSSNNNNVATAQFPRLARLRKPQQFQQTFSQGRRIGAALFRLHVHFSLPAQDQSVRRELLKGHAASPRLGIAVSKRVDPHAVGRNRIKRLARESFRVIRERLPAGDYVLLAQREAAAANNGQLMRALDALWTRAIALGETAESGSAGLKQSPAAITMPAGDMFAADPGRLPELP